MSVIEREEHMPTNEVAQVIAMVERVAMNPDLPVERFEKMLDMQERILDRDARMAYDSALADLQAELPAVEKLAEGHNTKYAKFEHILAAIKPHLAKHGFSITHRVTVENGLVMVTGILAHRNGHREETTLPLPPDSSGSKNAVQAVGSSTEYGRRYTMNSLLGIATRDADKDGGAPVDLVSEEQAADLNALIDEVKADKAKFLKWAKVSQVSDIPASKYSACLKALEEKRK